MSDEIEPVAKRRRNRKSLAVPRAQQSSTSRPTSNETQEQLPSNSLLRLSDGILQKIFVHLDISTLCDVADVCKRFRKVAKEAFSEKHKKFVLSSYNDCTDLVFIRVLHKFGDLITSLAPSEDQFDSDADADAIAKFCSKNLEELSLEHVTINCAAFMPIFARLKVLELESCEFIGDSTKLFKSCTNLEKFYFVAGESYTGVVQKYPKLTGLDFDSSFSMRHLFFNLLALNPQLKFIRAMEFAQDIYISHFVKYSKNVERLHIEPQLMASRPKVQTRKVFLELAKLKKLKKLTLDAGDIDGAYAKSVTQLADAFVKQNIALSELDLDSVVIGTSEIKSIVNLKSLEVLSLRGVKSTVKGADLISLTTKLPLLSNLQLRFDHDGTYSLQVDVLVKMVKAAKKMTYLFLIGVKDLKINQKDFKALLEAAQKRDVVEKLTIHFVGCQGTLGVNVPQKDQDANVKHLQIICELSNDEDEEDDDDDDNNDDDDD